MNRLNWIQQEQKIADYHVLTWPTSHFHSRTLVNAAGAVKSKPESGGMSAPGTQKNADAIGLGLNDQSKSGKWKAGGIGPDGLLEDGRIDAKSKETLSAPGRKTGRRTGSVEQTAPPLPGMIPKEAYHAVYSAGRSIARIRSRIRQGIGKVRDYYKSQPQNQSVGTSVKQGMQQKTPEKEKQGTRKATKEDMLFMQSQNHYLLDSYDKSGRYSILGK